MNSGNKIKVCLSYLAYPFCMANYFRRALERRNDVELFTVGTFTNQFIPWNGGMQIPNKYPNQVDLPLPQGNPNWMQIEGQLPWKPDLSLTIDAGWYYITKPDCLSAHVATDPHVLDYSVGRRNSDYFFNMQYSYLQPNDHLLPYAFDVDAHRPERSTLQLMPDGSIEKEYDAVLVGLHYPNRNEWVSRLQAKGIKVNYRIGDIYNEYREENNKAWIGLNWSSLNDVTARVFEIMAMRLCPVLNRLPGLDYMGFEEGRHYLGFSSMEEAVSQVEWAMGNRPFAEQIALNAYQFVNERNMTWGSRVDQILKTVGLINEK
jgi:hypothetical protein